jgi:hypothetical protein
LFPPLPVNFTGAGVGAFTGTVAVVVVVDVVVVVVGGLTGAVVGGLTGAVVAGLAGLGFAAAEDSLVSIERIKTAFRNFMVLNQLSVLN